MHQLYIAYIRYRRDGGPVGPAVRSVPAIVAADEWSALVFADPKAANRGAYILGVFDTRDAAAEAARTSWEALTEKDARGRPQWAF